MRYYRRRTETGGEGALIAVDEDGEAFDLTAAEPSLDSFGALARTARAAGETPDGLAERTRRAAADLDGVPEAVGRPVVPAEVWAAGVTYQISEEARQGESDMPKMYVQVYDADRPELFFKATPSRTVGPGEDIGVRSDSDWNVPEPELGIVLHRGEIVGYTVGNDVSSREIEGRNPLYLPQAKVYDRCCALGPCVASPSVVGDPHDLGMRMRIVRGGETVYEGATSTAEMVRTCQELTDWLGRHNRLPETTVLLTGTSLVPPDEFSLQADDHVSIDIEGIGTLENDVRSV